MRYGEIDFKILSLTLIIIVALITVFGIHTSNKWYENKAELDSLKIDFGLLQGKYDASDNYQLIELIEWNVRQNCAQIQTDQPYYNTYFDYDDKGAIVFGCKGNSTGDRELDKFLKHTLIGLGQKDLNLSRISCLRK